jgi:hypothetical protein
MPTSLAFKSRCHVISFIALYVTALFSDLGFLFALSCSGLQSGIYSRYHILLRIQFSLLMENGIWKEFVFNMQEEYLSLSNITAKYFCIINFRTEHEIYNLNIIRILCDVYVLDVYCHSEITGPHIEKSWSSKYDISLKILPRKIHHISNIIHNYQFEYLEYRMGYDGENNINTKLNISELNYENIRSILWPIRKLIIREQT